LPGRVVEEPAASCKLRDWSVICVKRKASSGGVLAVQVVGKKRLGLGIRREVGDRGGINKREASQEDGRKWSFDMSWGEDCAFATLNTKCERARSGDDREKGRA